jgi:hypothetical protein
MDLRDRPFSDIYRQFPVSGTTETQLEHEGLQAVFVRIKLEKLTNLRKIRNIKKEIR